VHKLDLASTFSTQEVNTNGLMYFWYHKAASPGDIPLMSGSFKLKTARARTINIKMMFDGGIGLLTSPALCRLASTQLVDRAGGTVHAALHSNETKATIPIG
jgi:hypothetical protein